MKAVAVGVILATAAAAAGCSSSTAPKAVASVGDGAVQLEVLAPTTTPGITTREALQLHFSCGALAARTSGSSLSAVGGEVLKDLVC